MEKVDMQIIRFLLQRTDWTTANVIGLSIGCSVRSVKSHISEINENSKNLILSSRSGYQITNRALATRIINQKSSVTPQDNDERRTWVLRKLLLDSQPISLDVLASELCISFQTLERLVASLKPRLAMYDLSLKSKNDYIFLRGSECNMRNMLIDLIHDEIYDSFTNLSLIQTFLPNVDVRAIREIIMDSLLKCNHYIDDYSLTNLILFLAISMEREIATSRSPKSSSPKEIAFPPHIVMIVEQIRSQFQRQFQIEFSDTDMQDFAFLLMSRLGFKLDPRFAIDPCVERLTTLIQKRVKHVFDLEFTQNDNMVRFSIHLQNMLIRLRNNLTFKNPDLSAFKKSFPYIYEVAVAIAEIITQEVGCAVPEDEIGFLAIYIGVFLEDQKNYENKVRTVLFCPKYLTTHITLAKRINSIFSDKILLLDILSDPSELSTFRDFDFIISTISPLHMADEAIVYISSQLDTKEIIAIDNEIVRQRILRMRNIFEEDLSNLFRDELYFYSLPFKKEDEFIDYMFNALYKGGYVNPNFKDGILAREKVCSSALGNVAIPHPIEACSRKSVIAVSVQPNGIQWGDNKVNLILMLSICPEDMLLFKDIFEFVNEYISDTSNLQRLMRADTNQKFKKLISSFFESKLNTLYYKGD